jgi:hypothetical protein
MEKTTGKTVVSPSREFAIPLGLLRTFQTDIRVKPKIDHPNGYITFDLPMLVSVLRGKDIGRARELANELEKMGKAGGELIIMQR